MKEKVALDKALNELMEPEYYLAKENNQNSFVRFYEKWRNESTLSWKPVLRPRDLD